VHPVLRPGLRVFRRDDEHLQVGLDDERVVLTGTPGVRRLLADLESGKDPGILSPEAGLVLCDLVDRGLVVDRAQLAAAVSGTGSRDAACATFATHGPGAADRIAARRRCRVAVTGPEPWTRTAADWLATAGIRVVGTSRSASPVATLVVSRGEPPRSQLDHWVRDERPHLLVALTPDRVRVGPFVSPGLTACLRCVDAHLAEADPRRGLVLEQLEGPQPPTDPYDPVLAQVGVALAVRDLTSYVDGDRPATWSTTLTVAADLALPRRLWTRHPHCGCSWG
jgi:hypothetical protein